MWMQHKYVQAISLTHVVPLVYPLSWTSSFHMGMRRETKHSAPFKEGKLRHKCIKSRIFSGSGQAKTWVLQGAKVEAAAQSAPHWLCLSQNNWESWNNGTTDCLFLLLAASCSGFRIQLLWISVLSCSARADLFTCLRDAERIWLSRHGFVLKISPYTD